MNMWVNDALFLLQPFAFHSQQLLQYEINLKNVGPN